MPIETPAVLACKADKTEGEAQTATDQWIKIGVTVLFAAAAVFFASFLAVVTGLV